MGLFRRDRGPKVDHGLPDGAWMSASDNVYQRTIARYYGTPETMARGGDDAADRGDAGVALLFYRKSIDMLHTAYGFNEMRTRQPSFDDLAILDRFVSTLEGIRGTRPGAPVEETVREVTHRLRSISTTCDARGLNSGPYRTVLDRVGAAAPDVPVDDVFWT